MNVRSFFKRFASVVAVAASTAAPALGWGHQGHLLVSEAGARSFPPDLPAFVRTVDAIDEIRDLGPELDESKGSGNPHDADLDPGHYVNIGDDGTAAGVPIASLPKDREAYDTALRRANTDEYKIGFLPFSLIDGWQQVVKDFAYWRVLALGEQRSTDPSERAFFEAQRRLRETLTLRDIGVWSHYVGDASQPLHTSSHYDGWDRFADSKGIHARFETAFVVKNVTLAAVLAAIPPYHPCGCTIGQFVARYLAATNAQVVPLYELGAATDSFRDATPAAVTFATARVAAGATALRDLVAEAWAASASAAVGYPAVNVRDLESGAVPVTRKLIGND
jgi:hypothetical protein